MININKHKFLLLQILKDVYSDIELGKYLGFKGGTALMFFYELPRFSVDLDFDLLNIEMEDLVCEKVRNILLEYGSIHDEAQKYYGPLFVLNYGYGERKLKVEISKRNFENRYEIRSLLGISVKVMVKEDLFAHKLCALLDRASVTNRDIFDCWFFMEKRTPVNRKIVEFRMEMPFADYLQKCINMLESMSNRGLLQGLGELMDQNLKTFVQNELRQETISLLKFYKEFPVT